MYMIQNIGEVAQLVGGLIVSIGYIPQIKQLLKTKDAESMNFKTFFLVAFGILGIQVNAVILALKGAGIAFLITNSISLLCATTMAFLVGKYQLQAKKRKTAN